MSRHIIGVTFLGVVACAGSYHVPAQFQGNTPLIIANQTSVPLCSFRLTPQGIVGGDEWIGLIKPQPGTSKQLKVRPGVYTVIVMGCQNNFSGALARLDIAGPTNLTLTPVNDFMGPDKQKLSEVPGYRHIAVPVRMSVAYLRSMAPAPAVGGGESGPAEAGGGDQGNSGEGASDEGASGDSGSSEDSSSSSESSSDSSSSDSSSESSSPAPAAPRDCKPVGAVDDNVHECCSDSDKLTPDHTQHVCCDHESDSSCS
jgi:hypothetical protein